MQGEHLENRDCARAAEAIEDLGDGHVGRVRRRLLRRHVKECQECESYLNRMSAVVEALASVQAVSAGDDFARLVMDRLLISLADAVIEQVEEHRSRRNLLWVAAAGLGVAMAVGLAIVRWVLGREGHEKLVIARPA